MNNGMVDMPEIRCQRGHDQHPTKTVAVLLSKPHGYHDYPQVPANLARSFLMNIWGWDDVRLGTDGYCPAVDAVSQTIEQLGIWEPCETILTLSIMEAAAPDSIFVDFGAQIGWFSLLTASTGHDVIAIEADPDCVELVQRNAELNGWSHRVDVKQMRVDDLNVWADWRHIALAKIDIEGAEADAIGMMSWAIDNGMVDHLLIEISPVFNDSYPALVARLIHAGYAVYALPDKATPPARFENFPDDLVAPDRWSFVKGYMNDARREVASWHQRNVLFSRPGAPI